MTLVIDFITHADVLIDPDVPVPDWPLNERGRVRHQEHADAARSNPAAALWSSDEQKARDAAAILGAAWSLTPQIDPLLHENDRSATGYMPPEAFAEAVQAFFGKPDESYRGWETARAAQGRIVAAVDRIGEQSAAGPVAIVAHGGVGTLLLCHIMTRPISPDMDQPGGSGGNVFRFRWPDWTLIHGWRDISEV